MERAALLMGAEAALSERMQVRLPADAMAAYERDQELVKDALGASFRSKWQQGEQLSLEELRARITG